MKKPIEVFLRTCYYSKIQELPDRIRPKWFNKNKVFENFKNTLDPSLVNYTIVYDEFYGEIGKTFLAQEKNVEIIKQGSECDSFLSTLDIIQSKNFSDEQIIYFLEDDYVHRPNWGEILLEGFKLNSEYVTLYDLEEFNHHKIFCKVFSTSSCHWRSITATTNTFACKYRVLKEDLGIHRKYSSECAMKKEDGRHFSKDYEKFVELQQKGRLIISAIPGWSTHCDNNYLSPVTDWQKVLNETYSLDKSSNEKSFNYS